MVILYIPDIEQPVATLIRRDWFDTPGDFLGVVGPSGCKILRAIAQGCGGSGEVIGGGGAYARSKVVTNDTLSYTIQVGNTSTASQPGDSGVWLGSKSTTPIVYADRGRGAGPGGKAANSIGDVRRDGQDGGQGPDAAWGGLPGGDVGEAAGLGFSGEAADLTAPNDYPKHATPGGGGFSLPVYNDISQFVGYYAGYMGGHGRVCMEWWDADPGY